MEKDFTVGSLFSGIGLLDLGLEQAGMKTAWQVEYDDWARDKLDENFPYTEKFKDVREVGKHNLKRVDCIAGGFPCTDLSPSKFNAQGLGGESSGLWFEFARILREIRPRYALIENVPKLAVFGLDRVMCDLARIEYDAQWKTLRASDFGLRHKRKRLFIFAHSTSKRLEKSGLFDYGIHPGGNKREIQEQFPRVYFEHLGRFYPTIPEDLRLDDGSAFELSDVKAAIKGYGNGVVVPVAKWIGEQILRFENQSVEDR